MAVVKMPQTSQLGIKVQTGVSAAGNPVYRTRIFRNLKPAAADADVYDIGQDLGALQVSPVAALVRTDDGTLVSQ